MTRVVFGVGECYAEELAETPSGDVYLVRGHGCSIWEAIETTLDVVERLAGGEPPESFIQ